MTVAHILDAKGGTVVTIAPDQTIAQVAALLAAKGIGAVLVTSGEQELVGILSERDIIRALARDGAAVLDSKASTLMTARVTTATRKMTIEEAMTRMTSGRFRHLPVVEGGKLLGLISIGDVVKHRIEQVETEKKSMLDYIGAS